MAHQGLVYHVITLVLDFPNNQIQLVCPTFQQGSVILPVFRITSPLKTENHFTTQISLSYLRNTAKRIKIENARNADLVHQHQSLSALNKFFYVKSH